MAGWLALLGFGLLARLAVACLNDHAATKLDGTWQSSDDSSYVMRPLPIRRNLAAEAQANRRRRQQLDHLWYTRHRLADCAGYGLTLVYLGRYAEAREVLEQLGPGSQTSTNRPPISARCTSCRGVTR